MTKMETYAFILMLLERLEPTAEKHAAIRLIETEMKELREKLEDRRAQREVYGLAFDRAFEDAIELFESLNIRKAAPQSSNS